MTQGRRPDHPGRRLRARAALRGPRRCCTASSGCRRRSRTRTSRRSSAAGTHRCLADEIGSRLRARFGDDVEVADAFGTHAVATVTVDRYHDVCRFLPRRAGASRATTATSPAASTSAPRTGFEVVTAPLLDRAPPRRAREGAAARTTDPCVPTISDLFPTSNWHERETMEMFGIRFEGHPHPVRLLLAEPFEGLPAAQGLPVDDAARPSRGRGPSRARRTRRTTS